MIKTIKVKKQLRLDELLKYVWDEDFSVRGYTVFRSDCDKFEVRVSAHMLDYVWDNTSKFSDVPRHATFTVEVEEEITKCQKFNKIFTVYKKANSDEMGSGEFLRSSITDVLVRHFDCEVIKIYALIHSSLELIWETDKNE